MCISHSHGIELDRFIQVVDPFRSQLDLKISLAEKVVCLGSRWLNSNRLRKNFDRPIEVLPRYPQAAKTDQSHGVISVPRQRLNICLFGFVEVLLNEIRG